MEICDLCTKSSKGKELFRMISAYHHDDTYSIHFAHIDTDQARYPWNNAHKVICSECLQKIGIAELLQECSEVLDRVSREEQIKVYGSASKKLNPGPKALPESPKMLEFKLE